MKNIPYALVVGSLMYAQVCTRPDIVFAVGMLGRYQSNPGINHWRAAKKVMRYLQGTKDNMLMYRQTDNLDVIGYLDSDFASCVDSRESTSGYIFMMAELFCVVMCLRKGPIKNQYWLLSFIFQDCHLFYLISKFLFKF